MPQDIYFGCYARFESPSKNIAAELMGADNLVGDAYSIEFREGEDEVTRAWLVNRFGGEIGCLDPKLSRRLNILSARGWTLGASLSFVAYTDTPDPGVYWGEVALMCSDPQYERVFALFRKNVSSKLAEGIRPEVNLGDQGVASLVGGDGSWMPSKTIALPKMKKGSAIMKSRRSFSEKMIEKGREGNKGCYAISIAFIVLLVALVVFALHAIGLF